MAPRRASALLALPCLARPQQCVAYGRVSTEKQREEQTIDTQVDLLVGDINGRDPSVSGRNIPESEQRKLVGQYWDDGVTGTDPLEKRPEGKRLVQEICRRGDIRCQGNCGSQTVIDSVWITKLDRLARKLQVLIEIEAFFRAHGVALRCLDLNIDTSDRNGKLMFQILGVIAEWERETIMERTDGGRVTKARRARMWEADPPSDSRPTATDTSLSTTRSLTSPTA